MVKERMDLLELLRKGGMDGDVDFLREALRVLVEGIMDAEVSSRIGAEYGERSPERVTQRNGYRSRAWDTRVGTMDLHIPKLREGSYFPSLLEPRRRSERALLAVIQQAYVEGVSTRRVDDLVKALGCEGISKSQVSRICQELDVVVDLPIWLHGPSAGRWLWLDAACDFMTRSNRVDWDAKATEGQGAITATLPQVHVQLRVTDQLRNRFPQVASLLDQAGPDVLAFSNFPLAHWKKIWSNNPQERLNNGEHRCGGHLPTGRPCAASLAPSWLNSSDEWAVGRRYTTPVVLTLNPNPPKDTDGREDSGRGWVRGYRGDGLGSWGSDGLHAAQGP